ncbi:MAG: hypothetical protein J6M60_03645 [Clostridia bacterium]|nr:hypothetical protein [Clostridia bacterium]
MNKIINESIKWFNENKNVLWKAYEADKSDFKYEYTKLIKIIESYKEKEIKKENFGLICYTDGNPYITVHLCMQAILSESLILICNQNEMNNLNRTIIRIFKEISNYAPRIENRITAEKLYLFTENGREKIIVFNDKSRYETIKSFGLPVSFKKV